ncbi:ADP/ATP-dependent (S)-NAD(P)H-hydrate dehydratase, partial [Actinomyces sp. MRS3W]|uniref:ADP-dependent NAD(P)H-hydrate dehydratase n=1 Tax=Actinomyces sp. MRS3W TaxID=2800796 RepID=UPI0028FCFEB6
AGAHDHKYTRGVVGLWAGSQTYPGAAVLTASAAVRTGAGMARLVAPARVADLVLARRPEVVPADGRCQALVIGPGTDPADTARAAELSATLDRARGDLAAAAPVSDPTTSGIPAVIDAGALPLLAAKITSGGRFAPWHVLTPHAGEAAALLAALGERSTREDIEAAPAVAVRRLAELTGATVLLKTTPTLIAAPGEVLVSVDSGPGWLATAGSGDVLAGIIGALLAAAQADAETGGTGLGGEAAARCAALGVRLHAFAAAHAAGVVDTAAAAGQASGHPIAALDVAEAIPTTWERLWSVGRGPATGISGNSVCELSA